VSDLPSGRTRAALGRFLEDYGYRGVREAEIGAPRWAEDPTLMFAALRSHLDSSVDMAARDRDLQKAREDAERKLQKSIPLPLRPAVGKLLDVVRRFTRMREHLRGHVVEVLGMFRRVALEASRRIESREPEAGSNAAFFLTLTEVRRVLYDDKNRVAVRVQRRRLEYERNRKLPEPPTTFVGFPQDDTSVVATAKLLKGLAASRGLAEGKVRILKDPSQAADFAPGEVLVVAAADTGWAPLFLAASAVVTELGGPLSHAAIILREYGVPAVVNVTNATQSLRDGDIVRVDGDEGTVQVLGA